jgi:hypothetical protein
MLDVSVEVEQNRYSITTTTTTTIDTDTLKTQKMWNACGMLCGIARLSQLEL